VFGSGGGEAARSCTIPGGSPVLRPDGLQARIRRNLSVPYHDAHPRGALGAWEGGTNLDGGVLQP